MADTALWAVWQSTHLPGDDSWIVSFVPPADEAALEGRFAARLLRARTLTPAFKAQAIEVYQRLVTAIGLATVGTQTLRQAFTRDEGASSWWLHPVAARDSESDPTYRRIVQVLVIAAAARGKGAHSIVLVGADAVVARVLSTLFHVTAIAERPEPSVTSTVLRGLAGRARFVWRTIRDARRARMATGRGSLRKLDVAYSSFYDWSVRWNAGEGVLHDRYLGNLDAELKAAGLTSTAHFAWLDLAFEPSTARQDTAARLDAIQGRSDLVLLQRYLTAGEIFREAANFRELRLIAAALRSPQFRAAFVVDGIDWSGLFITTLVRGCANANIPRGRLVSLAVRRAAAEMQPRVLLSFLEHFPHSRAVYDGVRQAKSHTECCAVQHASWSREKTFYYLDSVLEVDGGPDGVRVPAPNRVFVMGTLGESLFSTVGYPSGNVEPTGSPRFPGVDQWLAWESPRQKELSEATPFRVLFAASLDADTEADGVEALVLASRQVPGVELRVRSHPFSRLGADPRLARFHDDFVFSGGDLRAGSLLAALSEVDLVVVTYSTVGEEALVRGIPVVRWRPMIFDGSALAQVNDVPCATTVDELAGMLRNAVKQRGTPVLAARRRTIADQLFGPVGGDPAHRIARRLATLH